MRSITLFGVHRNTDRWNNIPIFHSNSLNTALGTGYHSVKCGVRVKQSKTLNVSFGSTAARHIFFLNDRYLKGKLENLSFYFRKHFSHSIENPGSAAAVEAGYSNASHLIAIFKKKYGKSPHQIKVRIVVISQSSAVEKVPFQPHTHRKKPETIRR